jgi:hypothetical protein
MNECGAEPERDRVRFIVSSRREPALDGLGDHRVLRRIAGAAKALLDRANRDPLIRDAVILSPCLQRRHEPAIDVRCVGASVPADFLERNVVDPIGHLQFVEPFAKAHEAHASAIVSAGLEVLRAGGQCAFPFAHAKAGRRP